MNKATLNQIATYSPINTFLAFSRGESRGHDTYGYPILRLTCSSSGEVFKCMGGGYDMHGTNLGSFLTSTVREYPEALKALATGVYNEIHKDAIDAYYSTNPYEIHKEENGLDFAISLDDAKKLDKE